MSNCQLSKCAAACAIALAGLGAVSAANAARYVGSWDPKYGSPFEGANGGSTADDLWWSGVAFLDIPDVPACAPNASMLVSCAGMFVTGAKVELREGPGGLLLDTLNFGGSAAVGQAKLDGAGNVLWIQSNYFEPLVPGTSSTFGLSNYLFSLGFDGSDDPLERGAMLFHTHKDAILDKHGDHGGQEGVFWNGVGKGHLGELCSPTSGVPDGDRCGFSDEYGSVIFVPIPEPSTYALMLAGLGAVGWMARRRRPVAA